MKNVKVFQIKIVILTVVKNRCMLHGRFRNVFFFFFLSTALRTFNPQYWKIQYFSSKSSFFLLKNINITLRML